jgi:hypothetical protein
LRALSRLILSARELKKAALQQTHPGWTAAQVKAEVRRQFLFARDER